MANFENQKWLCPETALSIVPPRHLWAPVDRLRALYDRAYEKWPPHINLIYPFVTPDPLPRVADKIQEALQAREDANNIRLSLDAVGVFSHPRHGNTIYLRDSDQERLSNLAGLRNSILEALGQSRESQFRMHMKVAESKDINSDVHKFLQEKVGLLPAVEWDVEELLLLLREQVQLGGNITSRMRIWGTVSLKTGSLTRHHTPKEFYDQHQTFDHRSTSRTEDEVPEKDPLQTTPSFYFDDEMLLWLPFSESSSSEKQDMPSHLVVSSYNVLAEFSWPPSQARYPLLVKNILSDRAAADVLVLQEITDDFLSHLLRDERIRDLYPFVSHGPPKQSDIEPLPSLLNLVILSKFAFDWEWVPFSRKHKGSVVAKLRDIGKTKDGKFIPTVVAAVHLNCGLTDGAVTAKKVDIQTILNYLPKSYPENPWILAGDFTIPTSTFSIKAAIEKGALSAQSAGYLAGFEKTFSEAKLLDAWTVSRSELADMSGANENTGDDLVEGEEGATHDPLVNEVAARIVGSGYNMRPQRYDRILVRGAGLLSITRFNKFGFLKERVGDEEDAEPTYASDHWGVRCLLSVGSEEPEKTSAEIEQLVVPVVLAPAPASLAEEASVDNCLAELGVVPLDEEMGKRRAVFDLLKRVLLESDTNPGSYHKPRSQVIVVPVGSYGLGVWTSSSDIDCLCIGPFSSRTFFALAAQRLKKAADEGVRILRRVKANTGTMLELEIQGVKMDLQYCPATYISENWPHVLRLPPSDPVGTLSAPTLSKLKAIRDLDYLRRSIPDMANFRIAHRFIKTWAKSRGIYSAKFGYLGGYQISILLARVCKLLARDHESVSVPDILATFFRHYASFDWKNKLVFDPFFHKQRLNYTRTSHEPLAILGYFPPSLNTSQAASQPSVRTIATEFKLADKLLSEAEQTNLTWPTFLSGGTSDFLTSYKSYVKIDLHYWGSSLSKGAQFLGWLESRCVMLLVDMDRRLTGVLHSRIWPARFVELEAAAATEEGSTDYQGCYLIGLEKIDPNLGKDEVKDALGALRTVLHRFEEQIRGDEKYFDDKTCWMSAEIVDRANLDKLGLTLDSREWGDYNPAEEESDDEEDEPEPDLSDEVISDSDLSHEQRKKARKPTTVETVIVPKLEPGKKFRTAADVMNRLRWDPELDSGDFVVGYLDRFLGAQEKSLDAWKGEQTDEEFIPQHRILYFKRRSDGVVVWERRTRKDEIFGSGA
jgi:poly(A) polymerase Pap1/uncharacterized protein (UPF0248 family)/2'-5' RNA ligase